MPTTLVAVPDVEAELDRLYALPLEEFTAARNDLAKRLRRAGQRDTAETVAKLSKPSSVAWAVNQLARQRPEELGDLVAAAARLREAQEAALRTGAGDELRAATAAERAAVRTLTGHARELLGARAATLGERVAALLHAAAIDEAARPLLERGRLTDEIDAPGFGLVPDVPPRARRPRGERPRRAEAVEQARARVREAAAEARAAREAAAALAEQAQEARRAADEASAAAEAADRRARGAAAELERAETDLATAEAR